MIDIGFLADLVGRARLDLSNEKAAQADLEAILQHHPGTSHLAVQREVRLAPGDIIDFVIDGIGLEMKVSKASKPGISRQLARYAQHAEIREALRALREKVTSEADYVGDKFAEEARKIHFKDVEARGIYGEATRDEVAGLIEDGVDFMPLPNLPEEHN